jgi:integrase
MGPLFRLFCPSNAPRCLSKKSNKAASSRWPEESGVLLWWEYQQRSPARLFSDKSRATVGGKLRWRQASSRMPIVRLSPAFIRHAVCPPNHTKIDYFDTIMRGFMLEVRSSGGKTYYQRYTDERGRERQFKVGPADVLTLRQARRKAQQIKAEAILGGNPQEERQQRRTIPTLQFFVKDYYLPFVKTYKRSWQTDETVLRVHVLPPLGHLCLDEVTTATITKVVASMRSDNYAPGTVARVVVILRYLFNLARKWKVLKGYDNPAAGIPVPPDVQRNRFLDKGEIARLVEILAEDENQVAAKAILLLLLTGARRNEISHSRWEHVDLKTSTLFVPLSKSGKPRYVILNEDAVALLRSIPQFSVNPYVFPSPVTGRPSASLYFPWHRIRTRAGLPDVRLHDLRHSFASTLVNEGWELYTVQRLLGHANAKSTQRYAHLSRETLAEAAEAMGSVVSPILEGALKHKTT